MPEPRLPTRLAARLGALLVCTLAVSVTGLPAAHATDTTVTLALAAGQSGSIGRVVSNTDVTPVSTCDPELSVHFDADLYGTVTVAPDATVGRYSCSVDYQVSGQSTGLIEHVVVTVVPTVSINDVAVLEGSPPLGPATATGVQPRISFQHRATFTVSLSEPPTGTVTVHAATADGTAKAPGDYTPVDTTLTFQPGQTVAFVEVVLTNDVAIEPDETFTVTLSDPTGAVIADGQGTGVIVNDDGL